jgi:hypothetical protein
MNVSSLFLDIGPEEATAAAEVAVAVVAAFMPPPPPRQVLYMAKNGLTVLTMQQAKRIKFALRNQRPVREATAQPGPAMINVHETQRQSPRSSLPPPPQTLWSSPALIGLDNAGDVARTTHSNEFQKEKLANTNADTNAKSRKCHRLLHMVERTDSLLGKNHVVLHAVPLSPTIESSITTGLQSLVKPVALVTVSPKPPTHSPRNVDGSGPQSDPAIVYSSVDAWVNPTGTTHSSCLVDITEPPVGPTAIPEYGTAMPEPTLSRILDDILGWKSPAPIRPEFQFFWTKQATEHNLSILEYYNMDLDCTLWSQPFGALTFGSELRPVNVLAPLFGCQPLWHQVRQYLAEGTSPPVTPIAEKDCLHDLGQMLKYGNHKLAEKEQERLVGMLREEVQQMWQLPLPRRAIAHIPDCVMPPLGMALQQAINKFNEIVAKCGD